jgi:hypothetical protein
MEPNMTDRLKGVSVTFTDDIREDDAEAVINAIRQLRGVLVVGPILADYRDVMAEQRVRHDLGKELMEIVYPTSHSEGCPAKTDVRANCAVLCRRYRRKGG